MEKENPESFEAEEQDIVAEVAAALVDIQETQELILHIFRTALLCVAATCIGLLLTALLLAVLP
jgi:hypothetical protein